MPRNNRNNRTDGSRAPQANSSKKTTAAKSRAARKRAARAARNSRVLNPERVLQDEPQQVLAYRAARRNPFLPEAAGAKVIDFDNNFSSTCRSDYERTFPAVAATFTSGFVQPTRTNSSSNGVATWIVTDAASSTSSDTVLDFTHVNCTTFDEAASTGPIGTTLCSEARMVGGGVRFEYRGADSVCSGELTVAPITQNQFQTYAWNSATEVSVSLLRKVPGAIVVPLSTLKNSSAVMRFVSLDYTSYTYCSGAIQNTGWTGVCYAVSGGPSATGYLRATCVAHWEMIPRGLNLAGATPPAKPSPRAIEREQIFDSNIDSVSTVVPSSKVTEVSDFMGAMNAFETAVTAAQFAAAFAGLGI